MAVSSVAVAQENDDMYFNSRDRVRLNEETQVALTARYKENDRLAVRTNPVNPSDSYSGRGVNPEFNAQAKNGATVVQENPDYFLSGYQPKNINRNQYAASSPSYSNCNCGLNNPYGMGYGGFGNPYGMGYGGFGNPYNSFSPYGNFYSPYGNGLTTSMGFGFGGFGSMYSMGMGYGMGSMYGNPYGMYNPYGYGNRYGYPTTIIVTGTDQGQAYGRRSSRSTSMNNNYVNTSGSAVTTNGRSRATGQERTSQSNYYNPSWRNDASNFTSPSRTNYNYGRSSAFPDNSQGRTWNTDPGRTRSTFDSFGSGSRGSVGAPSGGSSSGGSSGGRSRGRN